MNTDLEWIMKFKPKNHYCDDCGSVFHCKEDCNQHPIPAFGCACQDCGGACDTVEHEDLKRKRRERKKLLGKNRWKNEI